MAKYRVTGSPFDPTDHQDVEADGFFEEGTFTKFVGPDGDVVFAVPTKLVTKIQQL